MKALKIATLMVCMMAITTGICLAATNFSVEGYVYEKTTGQSLSGAHIYYRSGSTATKLTQTDENGFYRIEVDDQFGPPLKVQALVVLGQPDPIFFSNIDLPYPPQEGELYIRDIYVDIAKEYSDDYEFEMIAFVPDSPDARIPAETLEIELGVVVKNNSKTLPLEFRSLDFVAGLKRLNGESLNDRIITVAGQNQNLSVSARGSKTVRCSTMALAQTLEPGQYLIHGRLRNSIPDAYSQSGIHFNPDVDLETIITVADIRDEHDVLQAIGDVDAKVASTQNKLTRYYKKMMSYLRAIYNNVRRK